MATFEEDELQKSNSTYHDRYRYEDYVNTV